MISFDFPPLHYVISEIIPNLPRHHSEMTQEDNYGKLDIDIEYYVAASRAGQCRVVTIRDDGKLIGYSIFSISSNPRHQEMIEANNQGIFLEKEYRGQLSKALFEKSDEYLKSLGIHETNYTLSDDRIGRMLGGYKSKYKIWSKIYGQQSC